jgi:hypothetical protein
MKNIVLNSQDYSKVKETSICTSNVFSIEDIKRINANKGMSFFSPNTMRFFNSRVLGEVYGNRFFITSEKPPKGKRAYTVRVFNYETGSISTIIEFCKLTKSQAIKAAKALADDLILVKD